MTTKSAKFTGPVCSFCGVKEEEESCKALIENKDCTRYICDQCIKGIAALLKANPEENIFGICRRGTKSKEK